MEQCKVNGQDVGITDLDEAQDKIEGLEVEADSLKKELNEARITISELQDELNEQ